MKKIQAIKALRVWDKQGKYICNHSPQLVPKGLIVVNGYLISLVNCRRYVRHRDIRDLRWLKQKGAKIIPDYIHAKISDYHITDYVRRLKEMMERIEGIIMSKYFRNELSRFIPMDVQKRTLLKESFQIFLIDEMKGLLAEIHDMCAAQ